MKLLFFIFGLIIGYLIAEIQDCYSKMRNRNSIRSMKNERRKTA